MEIHRRHRRWRRTGDHRCLHFRVGPETVARSRLRIQPNHSILRSADRGVVRLAAGSDRSAWIGWLALGGADWRDGRHLRLVDSLARPREPSLAGATWPHRGGAPSAGITRVADGDQKAIRPAGIP